MVDAHSFRQCFFCYGFHLFLYASRVLGIGARHDTRAKITGLSKLGLDTLTETLLLKHTD